MKPWDLYSKLHSINYNTNAVDFNWKVWTDKEEKKIYIAVEYSTTVRDWIVNLLFFIIPQIRNWYLYFTPLGWQSAFNSCKELVMNEALYQINRHPDYDIECVGHSYGGASSVLTGIEIFFRTARRPNLTTFGAPRPMIFLVSKLLSRVFFKEVHQYAHRSDIVSYMPPLIGYWNIKVTRLGKFNLKDLFNPNKYHTCYGDSSMYEGVKID